MRWLSDNAVAHLRAAADLPDFSGTRYRIVREIARGGIGVVYEAEDVELRRRVAIKVLASELASEHAVEHMRDEARTIANLNIRESFRCTTPVCCLMGGSGTR